MVWGPREQCTLLLSCAHVAGSGPAPSSRKPFQLTHCQAALSLSQGLTGNWHL